MAVLKLETTIIRQKNVSPCLKSLKFSIGNCQTSRKMSAAHGKGGKDPQEAETEELGERGRRFEIQREGNLRSKKYLNPRE